MMKDKVLNKPSKTEQALKMTKDTLDVVNSRLFDVRSIGKRIVAITKAHNTLMDCGVCDESLIPIRAYLLQLTIEQNRIITDTLCDHNEQ